MYFPLYINLFLFSVKGVKKIGDLAQRELESKKEDEGKVFSFFKKQVKDRGSEVFINNRVTINRKIILPNLHPFLSFSRGLLTKIQFTEDLRYTLFYIFKKVTFSSKFPKRLLFGFRLDFFSVLLELRVCVVEQLVPGRSFPNHFLEEGNISSFVKFCFSTSPSLCIVRCGL